MLDVKQPKILMFDVIEGKILVFSVFEIPPSRPSKKSINAEKNENFELTHCRLPSGYKTQTENLKSFFVWYVKTCHRTTHRASRNRFAAISFHDYLHYFEIFLVHFSMKIDRNIISSLHIVFSLCARVGWCDVCTDFTNVIKVDENVDVNEMSLLNI